MKRIIILTVVFSLLITVGISANEPSIRDNNQTYFYLLEKNGFDVSSINYSKASGRKITEILNILFNENMNYNIDRKTRVTGNELFDILESDLGLSLKRIENRDKIKNEYLTFPIFFELIDYYFSEVLKECNLTKEIGTLSYNNGNYLLTYGKGKIKEYDIVSFSDMVDKMCDIEFVKDGDEIIELIPPCENLDISAIYDKKEIEGQLFLIYDNSIIISKNGALEKYFITDLFEILRRTDKEIYDKEIVLITGAYKKHSNLTAVAVERMN